jgi:hypothetical protein
LAVNTEEVALAVIGLLVESVLLEAESLNSRVSGALEAKVAGSVAVSNNIGPIAVVCLRVECESFGALKDICTAVDTVQELVAFGGLRSHSEVTELMGTVV